VPAERRILVAYATKYGSTQEAAEAIADALREDGHTVDLRNAKEAAFINAYDCVILGGSIYFGRWHPDAVRFLERYRKALAWTPFAVFALGPQKLEDGALTDSLAQLGRSLAKVRAPQPQLATVFGGVVDPAKLRFPLNRLPASDARDWDAIRAWAAEAAAVFEARPA
jgi:menaquinone-dependent protoporphyrinogen oxidase